MAIKGATELATGDLDGNGLADIVVGPWDGRLLTIITGKDFGVKNIEACERPIGLAIADLNDDTKGEILAACAEEDRLIVLSGVLDN